MDWFWHIVYPLGFALRATPQHVGKAGGLQILRCKGIEVKWLQLVPLREIDVGQASAPEEYGQSIALQSVPGRLNLLLQNNTTTKQPLLFPARVLWNRQNTVCLLFVCRTKLTNWGWCRCWFGTTFRVYGWVIPWWCYLAQYGNYVFYFSEWLF